MHSESGAWTNWSEFLLQQSSNGRTSLPATVLLTAVLLLWRGRKRCCRCPPSDVLGGPLFPSYRGPAEILLLLHGHGRFLSEGRLATPGFPVCSHSEMAAAFFEQTCGNVDLDFYSTTTTMDGGKKREGRSWRRKKCQNGNNGVFFELSWERLTTWLVAVACVLKQPVENLRCNHWFKCYYYNLFCYSSLELQKSGVKSTRVCM